MTSSTMTIQTSVLALLRGDVTASCVADRLGVTEAQVFEWLDTFYVAGVLALDELLSGRRCRDGGVVDPTTTTRHPIHPFDDQFE